MDTMESTQTMPVVPAEATPSVLEARPVVPPTIYQVSSPKKGASMRKFVFIPLLLVIVAAGVGTGFGAFTLFGPKATNSTGITGAPGTLNQNQLVVGKVYGLEDDKKFPSQSEGVIEKGGIDGEGTHHLIRPGGTSQTVYLTSSVVDLDLFVGSKVQIKGETFSAQKAAWFMDVGNVKVIELNVRTESNSSPTTTPAE